MKEHIQNRIAELQKTLGDCRTIIETCNQEIIEGKLVPSQLQQAQIDAIVEKGRNAIWEINHLNELLNKR